MLYYHMKSYHLEFLIDDIDSANLINDLLIILKFKSKVIRRDKGYMVYIKISEEISDFIKVLGSIIVSSFEICV